VQDAGGPLEIAEISEEVDLSKTKVTVAVSRLEEVGTVDVLPTGEVVAIEDEEVVEAAEEAAAAQENLRMFARSRIEMMRAYADMCDCRREFILNYFGEGYAPPCGNCDNCEAGLSLSRPSAAQPFPIKSRVKHKEWGPGRVMRYAGDTMVVLFDSVGYRTLAIDLVMEKELLSPAA
jgi:ATP-dependent DNA helicase RecQ